MSPTSLGFDAHGGRLEPPPQQLTIGEQGDGGVAGPSPPETSGGSWLSVTPVGGTAPTALTVTTDPSGLSQGIYRGSVIVTAPGATNSPRTVQVTLVVDPASAEEGRGGAGIVVAGDDAREYVTGVVRTSERYILLGRYNLVALRFSDVDVPRGAVIQSALVELYGVANTDGSVGLRYAAEDAGNSAPFKTENGDLSNRRRTQAFVDDIPDSWSPGVFNASPELGVVVQEVVERPDWSPGNSLTILIYDNESVQTRRIGSFEAAPSASRAARLTIRYQVP